MYVSCIVDCCEACALLPCKLAESLCKPRSGRKTLVRGGSHAVTAHACTCAMGVEHTQVPYIPVICVPVPLHACILGLVRTHAHALPARTPVCMSPLPCTQDADGTRTRIRDEEEICRTDEPWRCRPARRTR